MTTATTAKPKTAKAIKSESEYIEGVGRRKTAIARVRATPSAKNSYTVNDVSVEKYFKTQELLAIVNAPLTREGFPGKYTVTVKVSGGGVHSQAEAVRHGLSRVLVKEDTTQKSELKKLGLLKRDSRKKERKHPGLKKARKASQWSKR